MSSPTPRARWRIVNLSERDELGADNRFHSVIEVTFEVIDTGTIGRITVPGNQLQPERTAELIQNRAQVLYDLMRMGG